VIAAAAAGDRRASDALDEVGHWIGIGLAGLVNILNPSCVVLGGLFSRIYPYVARTIEVELDRRALAAPRDQVVVVPATLGGDAPLLGAAEMTFEPFITDPAAWLGPRAGLAQLASA